MRTQNFHCRDIALRNTAMFVFQSTAIRVYSKILRDWSERSRSFSDRMIPVMQLSAEAYPGFHYPGFRSFGG